MQTATNPQTGEKVQWNGSAWVPLGSAESSPAPTGGPVYGPPPAAPKPAGPPSGYVPNPSKPGALTFQEGGPADPYRPGGEYDPNKPAGADGKLTVDQRNNQAFSDRAFRALRVYGGAGLGPRSAPGEAIAHLPFGAGTYILGTLPDSVGDSPDRQNSEQAKKDFATSILRSDSGSNAPEPEVQRLINTYFPSPGETDPAVIENYQQARIFALNGLRSKAGLPPLSEQEIKELAFMGAGAPQEAPSDTRKPTTSDDEVAAFVKANANLRPDQLRTLARAQLGRDIDNAEELLSAYKSGASFNDQVITPPNPTAESLKAGVGDVVEGLGDIPGLVINPLTAGLNWAAGTNYRPDFGQNLRDTLGLPEGNAAASAFNEAGASALGGAGIARTLSRLVTGIPQQVSNILAQEPIRQGIAGGTAGLAGQQAEQSGAGGAGQLAATVLGGLGGYGAANRVVRAVSPASASPRLIDLVRGGTSAGREVADNRAVVEAGQRQNIPIRQPDARPSTRADFAGVEASETGNRIVTPVLRSDTQAVKGRLGEVGGDGRVLDDFETGQRIQAGGDNYLARTKKESDAKYTHAETLGAGAKGEASDAMAAIDGQIAELTEEGANANKGVISYLQDIKSDLQGGASIAKLRGIRRNLRGQLSERNLTATDAERRVGIVLDGLGADIKRVLPADAQKAFQQADGFYRQRMEFKQQVIRRFVGAKNDPISPETAAARFQSFMKSKDFGRFSRMMDELDPEDRADIAATVADHLGKARNGEFSLSALSTNIENMSNRALAKVFGDDGASALQDLRIIARAKADTAGALNNSRSGVVANRMGLKDAIYGMFGGSVAGIPGAIGGMAIRNISEKVGSRRLANALLSPDFTKWLKGVPNNPSAAKPYITMLNNVAARSGPAAADIKAIQSTLLEAFAQSPGRAAAQQEGNGGQEPPQQ